jgi:hypothetical protein
MNFPRTTTILVLGALGALAGACAPEPGPTTVARRPPAARATAQPRDEATPSPTPAATAVPRALLRPPATAHVVFRGAVAVDAAYAVGFAGATIAGRGEGSVVAVDATGAAIAADAAGVIANNGGNWIADAGAGVIANNGGSVIANNGGSVIANDGSAYRALAQAAEAPPIGTVLPAAGMVVRVVSLATGEPLALGVGPDGAPVTALYSDAEGRFTAYLPTGTAGSVRIDATTAAGGDDRLALAQVASVDVAAQLDDDTSLATRYIREGFATRLLDLMTLAPDDAVRALGPIAGDGGEAGYARALAVMLSDAAKAGPVAGWPRERQLGVARRACDRVLAQVALEGAMLDTEDPPYDGPDEPAFAAIVDVLRYTRGNVVRKMRERQAAGEDPGAWFAALAEVKAAAAEGRRHELRKPADYMAFTVDELYLRPAQGEDERYARLRALTVEAGLSDGSQTPRLRAAVGGLMARIGIELGVDPALLRDLVGIITRGEGG